MKKAFHRLIVLLFSAVLCVITAGCIPAPVQTEPTDASSNEPALSYSLTYYYNIEYNMVNGDYVSEEIRQILESFGETGSFTPATPVTKTYTEIPEFENNAKGTDPICILLPDLDISKYRVCSWRDPKTRITDAGWYRIIGEPTAGMMTDEFVAYDVDSSGKITQYKTVNLGKYDRLGLDESRLENLSNTFSDRISSKIGAKQFYQYAYTTTSQTTYRVFTDSQDNLVIATAIELTQNGKLLTVDLYGVVS